VLGRDGGDPEPKCFILSEQCFPPALPTGGGEGVDCTAIIIIENARPYELAGVFLDLVRGFDVPVGTVVVLSSVSHLGRNGTAAYAGDIVAAMSRIREAYGRNVRVVHGFPVIGRGLVDDSTIRGLREIELWLAEVDGRRLGSLPDTSDYFIKHFLSTTSQTTSTNTHRQALKLPIALHSSDSGTFVSPGWEDLPRSLPTLGEEDERSLIQIMFAELNAKFALQLDTCPNTDRSCQLATDNPDEDRLGIVLAGSSHSVRLIDHLESANLRVVDSTVPDFRISETSVADLSAELADKISDLDPKKNVILVQLLDNSCYECKTPEGDRILPKRGKDGRFHVPGELRVIGKDTLWEHFLTLQPLFKTVKNFKAIVLTPLPRYLWHRCCDNPAHLTNSEDENFVREMGSCIRDLQIQLRNMIFMRKLKGVSFLNAVEALGIAQSHKSEETDLDRILALWGPDPVHPTAAAYRVLSDRIVEKIDTLMSETQTGSVQESNKPSKRKADNRDSLVSGSQAFAKRTERGTSRGASRGSHVRGRVMTPRHPIRGKFWPRRAGHGRWR
jgi:hypothetical protein